MRSAIDDLLDRQAIEDVLKLYCTAIDSLDFALLDQVFVRDAVADYTSSGGIRGSLPEIQAWLAQALEPFSVVQHLVTNTRIELDGDEAHSTCSLFNPLGLPAEGGTTAMLYCGGRYHDRLRRTPQGWRIVERVLETLYLDGKSPVR
jgi:3-phenylpropionate/cinnamic acid dioxygenase small subunit